MSIKTNNALLSLTNIWKHSENIKIQHRSKWWWACCQKTMQRFPLNSVISIVFLVNVAHRSYLQFPALHQLWQCWYASRMKNVCLLWPFVQVIISAGLVYTFPWSRWVLIVGLDKLGLNWAIRFIMSFRMTYHALASAHLGFGWPKSLRKAKANESTINESRMLLRDSNLQLEHDSMGFGKALFLQYQCFPTDVPRGSPSFAAKLLNLLYTTLLKRTLVLVTFQ